MRQAHFNGSYRLVGSHDPAATRLSVEVESGSLYRRRVLLPKSVYPFLLGWKYEHPHHSAQNDGLEYLGSRYFGAEELYWDPRQQEYMSIKVDFTRGKAVERYERDPSYANEFNLKTADNDLLFSCHRDTVWDGASFKFNVVRYLTRRKTGGTWVHSEADSPPSRTFFNNRADLWEMKVIVQLSNGLLWPLPVEVITQR